MSVLTLPMDSITERWLNNAEITTNLEQRKFFIRMAEKSIYHHIMALKIIVAELNSCNTKALPRYQNSASTKAYQYNVVHNTKS